MGKNRSDLVAFNLSVHAQCMGPANRRWKGGKEGHSAAVVSSLLTHPFLEDKYGKIIRPSALMSVANTNLENASEYEGTLSPVRWPLAQTAMDLWLPRRQRVVAWYIIWNSTGKSRINLSYSVWGSTQVHPYHRRVLVRNLWHHTWFWIQICIGAIFGVDNKWYRVVQMWDNVE